MIFPLMKEARRGDASLVVSLHGMRTVTGQVVGVGDGSPPVTAGHVTLTDTQKPESEHQSSLSAQGEFRLPNVPPGSYDLKIENAHDETKQYLDYSQSILIGDTDITGVRIVLTPSTRR